MNHIGFYRRAAFTACIALGLCGACDDDNKTNMNSATEADSGTDASSSSAAAGNPIWPAMVRAVP